MRRRVVNVLAVVSAVVCVLSLLLVGRSFFRSDVVWVSIGQNNSYGVVTIDGKLWVEQTGENVGWYYFGASAVQTRADLAALWGDLTGVRWLGIGWARYLSWGSSVGFIYYRLLILPLWMVPMVTVVLPVWWWRVRRRAGGRGFLVGEATERRSDEATEGAER